MKIVILKKDEVVVSKKFLKNLSELLGDTINFVNASEYVAYWLQDQIEKKES